MQGRRDALFAAAQMVEAVREIATRTPGRQVGTVRRFEVLPDAPNVIPGRVSPSIEFRDLSPEKNAQLGSEMLEKTQQVARERDTEITMTRVDHVLAALASKAI